MRVDMRFKVVNRRLLYVAQIPQAHSGMEHGKINSEHLPKRGSRGNGGGYDVVVVVALRENLVIRLPIIG